MPSLKNVTAYYPRNTSLHESLALKVITRVVSDGVSLRNAVREAIRIAELNKKDIFLLLAVLQDFGMVTNGDYKNYWTTGSGEGVGTQALDASQGTNYFASNNQKVVTAETEQMFQLFDQIEKMRAFASDEEIVEVNPELQEVLTTMQKTEKVASVMCDNGPLVEDDFEKTRFVKDPLGADLPGESYQDDLKDLEDAFLEKGASAQEKIVVAEPSGEGLLYRVLKMWNNEGQKEPIVNIIGKFAPQYTRLPIQQLTEKVKQIAQNHPELGIDANRIGDLLSHIEPKNLMNPGAEPQGMADLEQQKSHRDRMRQLQPASFKGRITVAIEEGAGLESLPAESAATAEAPAMAPAGDLTVEEPTAPAGDLTVEEGGADDQLNVTISPLPSELMDQAQNGPKWEINNLLSINKAEKYYTELKKQLEDVAINNPNISMDLASDAKYDKVRNMIDGELEKIGQAIKGKEKIEKKEDKLKEEITPEINVEENPASGTEPVQKAAGEPSGLEEVEPTTEGV